MRIGTKLALFLVGIAGLVGLVGYLGNRTNEAIRQKLEQAGGSSTRELLGATDMLLALSSTQAAVQALLSDAWRGHADGARSAHDEAKHERLRAAVTRGMATFEAHLASSRRATEGALAAAEQRGDARTAIEERRELTAWLDRLEDELVVHRALLEHLLELAERTPAEATRWLDERVEAHYHDVLFPLIEGYQADAENELSEALREVATALVEASRRNTAAVVLALGAAIVLGLLTARSIAHPIAALREATARIGRGDLDFEVTRRSRGEIGGLVDAFNGMAAQLRASTVSRAYFDAIIRSMREILIVSDMNGRIRTVNPAASEQLGWSEAELLGRDARELFRETDASGELSAVTREGTLLPVVCVPTELSDAEGVAQGRLWLAQSIRQRKETEEMLRRALAEQEVLLREVHHRVKNNLQVVSSILRLQASSSTEESARPLIESEGRIRSMALIHEQLHRSRDLARIDFREYARELTRHLANASSQVGQPCRLQLDVEPVSLELDQAVPCGLVLNELVSNAFRHAFPEGRSGRVVVRFARTGERGVLTVSDDGVGFAPPPEGAETRRSLGLRLVEALARQLRGKLSIDGSAGARFELDFPIAAPGGESRIGSGEAA